MTEIAQLRALGKRFPSWPIPADPSDENAARELERLLPIDRRFGYRTMLGKVIARDHKRGEYWASDPIFASAAQRMESVLRVLDLWTD